MRALFHVNIVSLVFGTPLLALLLGPIVTVLLDVMKAGWARLDAAGPLVKQSAAVVLSFLLVGLAHFLPGSVPDACSNVAATGISDACQTALTSAKLLTGILTALVAVARKHGQQAAAATG